MAVELVDRARVRHGLFFAHPALEKALKAHVCRHTNDVAPRLHNLARLAELAGLQPTPRHLDILAEMTPFNLEGRYPEGLAPPASPEEARAILARAREVYEWLTHP